MALDGSGISSVATVGRVEKTPLKNLPKISRRHFYEEGWPSGKVPGLNPGGAGSTCDGSSILSPSSNLL